MPEFSRRAFLQSTLATAALAAAPRTLAAPKPQAAMPPPENAAVAPWALPPDFLLLSRTSFGVRPQDLDALRKLGPGFPKQKEAYIERQLHPEGINDSALEARLQPLGLSTLGKSLEQLWKDHVIAADALRDAQKAEAPAANSPKGPKPEGAKEAKKDENRLRTEPARDVEAATWMRAVYSERQLGEVLADFWHNHFNVFAYDGRAPRFSCITTAT
jgi:uncharacterized protein (DUF1800 family)